MPRRGGSRRRLARSKRFPGASIAVGLGHTLARVWPTEATHVPHVEVRSFA